MTIVYRANEIQGLSTDTKPTLVPANSSFFETDTLRTYNFDGTAWTLSGVGGSVSNAELDGSISLTKLASGTAGKNIGYNATTGVAEEQDAAGGGTFVGTGAEIAALTPTAGQSVFCTTSGSGFIANNQYNRNSANTVWNKVPDGSFYFGTGIDGDLVVSSGTTTLTSSRYYNNLTVNVGAILTADNPMTIFVKGTLTINGTISMVGKGGAGGIAVALNAGGVGSVGNMGSLAGSGGSTTAFASTNVGGVAGSAGTLNRVLYNPFDWISTTPRPNYVGAGGGAGGSQTSGSTGLTGVNGPAHPNFPSNNPKPGGAGGVGANLSTIVGGNGGAGGGTIAIFANSIIIGASGVISAAGQNGNIGTTNTGSNVNGFPGGNGIDGGYGGQHEDRGYYNTAGGGGQGGSGGPANGAGGGGGGTGGSIILTYKSITNNGSISVAGGIGGLGGGGYPGPHGAGGAGGAPGVSYPGNNVGPSRGPGVPGQPSVSNVTTGVPGIAGTNGSDGILVQSEI